MEAKSPPHVLICLFSLLVLAFAVQPMQAQTTNWITSGDDWFNAANWDDGIPGVQKDAFIDNGGTFQLMASKPPLVL